MADQLLTVEVEAKLDSLSTGLNKATKDIQNFVNTSIPGLDNLTKVLNSLGVNTASQSMEEIKRSTQGARTETELARKGLIEARTEQVKFRTELMQGKTVIEAAAGSYDETRQKLTALGKEIRAAGGAMDGTNPHITGMVEKYNLLNSKLKTVDSSMGNFQRNVGNYSMKSGQALTDFGRIAQDLPFGFMAIQNNLNPMLESFGRLKEESGSTGGALKAMAQGLVGPAGVGVALAVVSAGILLYQKYQQNAKKEVDKGADSNKKYQDSLNGISSSVSTQVASMAVLYDASQDQNRSLDDRGKLVEALQKQYPDYFGNLSKEAILAGKAANAYENLQQAMVNTAIVKASEGILAAKIKPLADLVLQINNQERKLQGQGLSEGDIGRRSQNTVVIDENGEIATLQKYRRKLEEEIRNTRDSLSKSMSGLSADSLLSSFGQGGKGGASGGSAVSGVTTDIRSLSDVLKNLDVDLTQARNQFSGTFGDERNDEVKAYQKAIDDLIKMGFDPASEAITRLKAAQQGLFSGDLGSVGKPGDIESGIPATTKIEPNLDLAPKITGVPEFQSRLDEITSKIDDFKERMLNSGISETMGGAFSAIGAAMAEGSNVFAAAGKSIISSIGSYLSELGQMLIKKGIATVAAGVALNIIAAGSGTKQVAGGIALIAAGGAMAIGSGAIGASTGAASNGGSGTKNNGPQYGVPHFASGGIVSGPTLAMVGEYPGAAHDPEVISPLSKLKSMIGGNNSNSVQGYIAETRISGQDLVMSFKRAEKNNARG